METPAKLESRFIRLSVLGTYVAPIASVVASERNQDICQIERTARFVRHSELAKPELWFRVGVHVGWLRHVIFLT